MSADVECPFCGETVKKVATKCRHCGEWLKKKRRSRGVLRWEGQNVLVATEGEINAGGCCMCGAERGLPTEKKFMWTPSWVWITVFLGLIVPIILGAILRKTSKVRLPLCKDCKSAWWISELVFILFAVFGIFGCPIVGSLIGSAISRRNGGAFGALLGLVAWLIGLVLLQTLHKGRKQAQCKLITDRAVTLKFPNPSILRGLLKESEQGDDD